MQGQIRGKVASIITTRELVINVGQSHGVTENMRFDIFSRDEYEIKDPDTKEIIGHVNIPKVRVEVITVQEKLSIARTYKKRMVNIGGGGLGDLSFKAFEPEEWVERVETLNVRTHLYGSLSDDEKLVYVGDIAVEVG